MASWLSPSHLWFNSYALEFLPIFYYRNKTRVQMLSEIVDYYSVMNNELC